MKSYSHIIGVAVLFIFVVISFKVIQKFSNKPQVKSNDSFSNREGNTCFGGKISVPLPGRSKCFDCEREMIARNGCNINAGARGNSTRSFDANRQGDRMFGTAYKAAPSRSFFADSHLIGKTPQYIF